jgi:F0F1-type ATP synthase assembly protein I
LEETRRTEPGRLTQAFLRVAVPSPPGVATDADDAAARERRQLTDGFGNALAKAFELAFTPAIFGFLGWLLDRRLGTEPLFLLLFVVIVFAYEVWKLLFAYSTELAEQQAKLLGRSVPAEPSQPEDTGP